MVITVDEPDAKRVTLLGSTGSIGYSSIKALKRSRKHYQLQNLVAGSNVSILIKQALTLLPKKVVIADSRHYHSVKEALSHTDIMVESGREAVIEAASDPCDIVISAITGAAGIEPTLAAIRQGARILLANKESLVCAGDLMLEEATHYDAEIIPVDSEHSAAFFLMENRPAQSIHTLTLTASGGPFWNLSPEEMRYVTKAQAIKHPVWDMGEKISVDSATMMNKGLELIEAYHLFPLGLNQIKLIVHPESIIHAMLQLKDGMTLSMMGKADMMIPITVGLDYPHYLEQADHHIAIEQLSRLQFSPIDEERFPATKLARQAVEAGNGMPIILNAANEMAVAEFLQEKIHFLEIIPLIEEALAKFQPRKISTLEDVIALDQEARNIMVSS